MRYRKALTMDRKHDNHEIPEHFENYIVTVFFHGGNTYTAIPFTPSPHYYEPHSENGMDILLRHDWTDAIKIVYDFPISIDHRRKVVKHIMSKFYPTSKFHKHIPAKS